MGFKGWRQTGEFQPQPPFAPAFAGRDQVLDQPGINPGEALRQNADRDMGMGEEKVLQCRDICLKGLSGQRKFRVFGRIRHDRLLVLSHKRYPLPFAMVYRF